MDLVLPKDRVLLDQLLEVTARKGRIDGLSARLVGDKGVTVPLNWTGYMLPDLKDHFFIAMRLSIRLDAKGIIEGKPRDKNTGPMSDDLFTEMAAKKLKNSGAVENATEITLFNLPNFQSFADSLPDADTWLRNFLAFEITESACVPDLKKANIFVQSLHSRGFYERLDDFGTAAASFQYLSVLEVDVVKLDGSAVKNAQSALKGRAFLKALMMPCKTMEVETIAEMVDSKETLEFVRGCGVEYVQGFLFGNPDLDPWQFIKKLDRRLFADTKR